MKNKFVMVGLTLFLAFLIFSFAEADIVTGVTNLENEGRVGDTLRYKVSFQNVGTDQTYISIFMAGDISTDKFNLIPGEIKTVYINYTVPSSATPGTLFLPVKLFDQNGIEYNYSLILQGLVLEPDYPFKTVRLSEVTVSKPEVNADATFSLNFVLTGVPKATTAAININAPFQLEYQRSLPLVVGRNEATVADLKVPVNAAPGRHNITLSITFTDKTVVYKDFLLTVTGYSRCELKEQTATKLTSKEYIATLANPGTAVATCPVSTEISSLEKMLLSGITKDYTYADGKISWNIDVPAGQSVSIGYTVNYIPVLVLPFVIIIIAVLFWYFSRKIEIVRELVSYKLYPGFMDIKLQVHVKNLSSNHYKSVKIKETLGAFVKDVKEYGTIKGEIITEHRKKKILWELNELKPKEERVFNYTIRTSVEVLGQINFDPTVMEYVDANGQVREESSGVFSIDIE